MIHTNFMTRGGKANRIGTMYDLSGVLFFDIFVWADRDKISRSIHEIFRSWKDEFPSAGAYLFHSFDPSNRNRTMLYIGETEKIPQRISQHFSGRPSTRNKFLQLNNYFVSHPNEQCILALLIALPQDIPYHDSPDGIVFEKGIVKRMTEALESVMLNAILQITGSLPLFNERNDVSKIRNDANTLQLHSLIRFLMDEEDSSRDYPTFRILSESRTASEYLSQKLDADPPGRLALMQLGSKR